MPEFGDLKGARVTVRSEKSDELICQTTVTEYDRQKRVITVDGHCLPGQEAVRVTLLVVSDRHMVESAGIARRLPGSGRWEIPLYHVKVKENRGATRYAVRTRAKVLRISMAGRMIPLDEPLEVAIVNISTSGVLISTDDPNLQVGSQLQLQLRTAGGDTAVNSAVVRELRTEQGERQLGCSFLSQEALRA